MKKKRTHKDQPEGTAIVFANYFDFLTDPAATPEDIVEFARLLAAYTQGNFDEPITGILMRMWMPRIRREMEQRAADYKAKLEALRRNSAKGGEANKARLEKKKSKASQQAPIISEYNRSQTPAETPEKKAPIISEYNRSQTPEKQASQQAPIISVYNSEKVKPNGSFWLSPHIILNPPNQEISIKNPPKNLEGEGLKFLEGFEIFRGAQALPLPPRLSDQLADLTRWRLSLPENAAALLPEVEKLGELDRLGELGATPATLEERLSALLRRVEKNPPPVSRPVWRLLSAVARIASGPQAVQFGGPEAVWLSFAAEVENSHPIEGEALWPILLEKADYITNPAERPVLHLAPFLKARKNTPI